jgi:hypothetical protein
MSHTVVEDPDLSSEWESCSAASTSSLNLSATRSSRTLNLSFDDHPTHEPLTVYPLLAASTTRSIAKSQLTPSHSISTSSNSTRLQGTSFYNLDASSDPPSTFAPADESRPVFLLPAPTYRPAPVIYPSNFAGMETVNVPELVERLGSEEDAVRKMAVFKLQSNIGDPSFAEIFILEGGLPKLKYLAMNASGNTLAYSLTSFSRLLEVDKGWDFVEQDLIERV